MKILGIEVKRAEKSQPYPSDFNEITKKIIADVRSFTMTSPERINALVNATLYISKFKIEGNIVECGVWKGGSMMAAALALKHCGDLSRDLYLYDTFAGMTAPGEADGDFARNKFADLRSAENSSSWCCSPLEEVRAHILSTGYPSNKLHFIKGEIESTIPKNLPEKIALLRLDTDWYESTKHELKHLFPLLQDKGVLIIDDYGRWEGARKAVDEYFHERCVPILLNRIDSTGRIAIKTS